MVGAHWLFKKVNKMTTLLSEIQDDLLKNDLDGVLILKSDPFLSGYYAPYKNRLKDVTSFSGSDGVALVLKQEGILFVDSRYTEQAKIQSDFKVFEVPSETRLSLWMKENMKGKKVLFDDKVHSLEWVEQMNVLLKESHITLVSDEKRLFDKWFKPVSFKQDLFDYDIKFSGSSSDEKIKKVQSYLSEKKLDALFVLSPENASWLLNKRDKNKSDYPVVYKRLIVMKNGDVLDFDENITLLQGLKTAVDLKKASLYLVNELKKNNVLIQHETEIIDELKAQKNSVEIQNIKEACLFESVVISKFLAFVEQYKETITEIDCDEKLKEFRALSSLYFYDSFQTIAASGPHAAQAHYAATKKTNAKIIDYPMLLVDTGGHYLNGTTDMTRTIAIGSVTPLMKQRYTEVLKGHIQVALSSLKEGDSTALMDEKAHQYLRASGVDYYHSTGHGIGMMLGVHEYPPAIHAKDEKGLNAGMVFSNEPAYYSAEEGFGIRLENMLLSVEKEDGGLEFENLLFIPFDYRLVDFELLSDQEKEWLKAYHQKIKDIILPNLTDDEKEILMPFILAFVKG